MRGPDLQVAQAPDSLTRLSEYFLGVIHFRIHPSGVFEPPRVEVAPKLPGTNFFLPHVVAAQQKEKMLAPGLELRHQCFLSTNQKLAHPKTAKTTISWQQIFLTQAHDKYLHIEHSQPPRFTSHSLSLSLSLFIPLLRSSFSSFLFPFPFPFPFSFILSSGSFFHSFSLLLIKSFSFFYLLPSFLPSFLIFFESSSPTT